MRESDLTNAKHIEGKSSCSESTSFNPNMSVPHLHSMSFNEGSHTDSKDLIKIDFMTRDKQGTCRAH